jgi:hypothetical protein
VLTDVVELVVESVVSDALADSAASPLSETGCTTVTEAVADDDVVVPDG